MGSRRAGATPHALAEHAFRLRRYADCIALRNHVLEMLELAEIEENEEKRRRCSANEVTLSNSEMIPSRTIISAVGTRPTRVVGGLPVAKDPRGRIVTERTCAVPGHPGVWAAGDCAAVEDPKGQICPPVALYAMKHGDRIGANIVRVLDGCATSA